MAAFGNLFWGVVLKPGKRYEQTVEESFHVSKACLEPQSSGGSKVVSVYIEVEGDEYLLCNLTSAANAGGLNESLDLNFNVGEKICFRTEGDGIVHLTGYLVPDDEYGGDEDMSDDGDMEEMEEEEDSEDDDNDVESGDDEDDEPPKLVKKRKMENGFALMAGGDSKKAKKTLKDNSPRAVEIIDDEDEDDFDEDEDDFDDDDDEEEGEDEDEVDDEEVAEKAKPAVGKKGSNKFAGSTPFKAAVNGAKKGGASPAQPSPKSDSTLASSESGDASASAKKKRNKKKKKNKKAGNDTSAVSAGEDAVPPSTPKDNKAATPNKKQGAGSEKTPKLTLKGGIIVEELKVGNGPEAARGKMVGMYYEGKLKSNNKKFDENKSGKPFRFRLGSGEVIKGWDVGIEGMKVGGKRRLVVPANMAYGAQGAGPDIPPNSTLVFEVECKTVN